MGLISSAGIYINQRSLIQYEHASFNRCRRQGIRGLHRSAKSGARIVLRSPRWLIDIIADPDSGMNCHKKGLRRLLDEIVACGVGRLEAQC
jgi:hypothetical protein